jgi:hypothetical protein
MKIKNYGSLEKNENMSCGAWQFEGEKYCIGQMDLQVTKNVSSTLQLTQGENEAA